MLAQNQLLRNIAYRLTTNRERFQEAHHYESRLIEMAVKKFIKGHRLKRHSRYAESFLSLFGEYLVKSDLEIICTGNSSVEFNPIQDGDSTERYLFQRRKDQLVVVDKLKSATTGDTVDYSELDDILVVSGLPVLFEVKLVSNYSDKQNSGKGHLKERGETPRNPSNLGLRSGLTQKGVARVIDPTVDFFGRDCGYVVIAYPDLIQPDRRTQEAFRRMGGILVPFYYDRDTYRNQIIPRVIEKYGLFSGNRKKQII